MEKNVLRKGIVIGIILIFLGAGVIPSYASLGKENKNDLLKN